MKTKKCRICNEEKELQDMGINKKYKDGYSCYCKSCVRNKTIKYSESSPFKRMIYNTRSSAKKRNIEFTLTENDIIIPEFCPYTGLRLTNLVCKGLLKTAATIDRVDNNKGYTKDNIMIISYRANKIKGEMSIEELLVFSKNVIKIHS